MDAVRETGDPLAWNPRSWRLQNQSASEGLGSLLLFLSIVEVDIFYLL